MLPVEPACPTASELAAYAEGVLEQPSCIAVARHVESCFECTAVVAEARLFLGERKRAAIRRRAVVAAAAAAIFVACLIGIARVARTADSLSALRTAAAELEQRPVEGRLVGFAHRPFEPRRSAAAPPQPTIALRAAADTIPEEDLHARGVAALLLGDEETAVRVLRAAVRAAPSDAAAWNDLAAAELALAADRDDAGMLSEAVNAADHALKLKPGFAPAEFNRGVALDHAGRKREAAIFYERAIQTDRSEEAWILETRERLETLLR